MGPPLFGTLQERLIQAREGPGRSGGSKSGHRDLGLKHSDMDDLREDYPSVAVWIESAEMRIKKMEADLTALRSKCDMLDRTINDESSALLQISDDEKVTDGPPVQRESVAGQPVQLLGNQCPLCLSLCLRCHRELIMTLATLALVVL